MCSRSFGQPIHSLTDLEEAVTHFAAKATAKLRTGQQYAGELTVFIRTNPFKTAAPQYSRSASVRLVNASQDSRVIVQQTLRLLRPLYREGFDYTKAGVMLSELVDETGLQDDLFESVATNTPDSARSERLMRVMDEINRKSRTTVYMAKEAGPAVYSMRRQYLSPAYTTVWDELPLVR